MDWGALDFLAVGFALIAFDVPLAQAAAHEQARMFRFIGVEFDFHGDESIRIFRLGLLCAGGLFTAFAALTMAGFAPAT